MGPILISIGFRISLPVFAARQPPAGLPPYHTAAPDGAAVHLTGIPVQGYRWVPFV